MVSDSAAAVLIQDVRCPDVVACWMSSTALETGLRRRAVCVRVETPEGFRHQIRVHWLEVLNLINSLLVEVPQSSDSFTGLPAKTSDRRPYAVGVSIFNLGLRFSGKLGNRANQISGHENNRDEEIPE